MLVKTSENELKPYLVLSETADKTAFEALMKTKGIRVTLKWRYYYGYKDAIRIIDFVETKGVYDAWVVFLMDDAQPIADKLVHENPKELSYFDEAEEQFLRGLEQPVLIKALASQQMFGLSLSLAIKILKEQQIEFSDEEIVKLKEGLRIENNKKKSRVGRTKIVIWLLLIAIGVFYLRMVGFF